MTELRLRASSRSEGKLSVVGSALVAATVCACSIEAVTFRPVDSGPLFPCEMSITSLEPATLVEGMGVGGSRPALLVISGQNIVNRNTTVSITAVAGAMRTTLLTIDPTKLEVGETGTHLAVPVSLPVDPMLPANELVPLDVSVAQDCPDARVTGTIQGQLVLKGLDELTGSTSLTGGVHEYSQIDVQTGVLGPAPNQTSPIILRSMSSVRIASTISVNAPDLRGGPAGGSGGAPGQVYGGLSHPGTGPCPGLSSGSGGCFDTTAPWLNTLDNPTRGSGGAGNEAILDSFGATCDGGAGGGGGGSIEISADGHLQLAAITARGARGGDGCSRMIGSGQVVVFGFGGGGGSGGVILLRAGGTLIAGSIEVQGGDGGARSGGAGAPGRARYDAAGAVALPDGTLGTGHFRGPMFAELPLTFRNARPELTLVGTPLSMFKYYLIRPGGAVGPLFTAMFDMNGAVSTPLPEDLVPGANLLCVVADATTVMTEIRNCVSVAYLP
jgi:hypothetical protein